MGISTTSDKLEAVLTISMPNHVYSLWPFIVMV